MTDVGLVRPLRIVIPLHREQLIVRWFLQGDTLSVLTPAKLNLSLDVLGRRPDGFHDLETVMLSIQLTDRLQFSPAPSEEIQLTCSSESSRSGVSRHTLAADDRNLVLRAARLLRDFTGCRSGVRMELLKRIPMEAGLGGGSSDAAATLVGLNRFWKLGLSSAELHPLAARLGSDVNFFLDSPIAAVCTGRGEQVAPIPVGQQLHFVLVKPPFGLSTADVFRRLAEQSCSGSGSTAEVRQALSAGRIDRLGARISNDLTEAAASLSAKLNQILSELAAEPVWGRGMSGTGSSCFALCRSARQARILARRWGQRGLGQVFAVSSGV